MKRVDSRRAGRRTATTETADWNLEMMEELLTDLSIDELREFLEADLLDVAVDPAFKERLREELWALVRERAQQVQQEKGGPDPSKSR